VDTHYASMIAQHPEISFDLEDIRTISMKMVFDFLYIYNSWHVQYRRKKYDNLDFKQEDFDDARAMILYSISTELTIRRIGRRNVPF
jgi:hypothetical protein